MTTMGDRWTDEMVDELFLNAPISRGLFNYKDFIRTLKHGARCENDDDGKIGPIGASSASVTPAAIPLTKVTNAGAESKKHAAAGCDQVNV